MRLFENRIARQGGVVTRKQLLAWGNSPAQVAHWRTSNNIRVLRRGWYALPGCDPEVEAAVRAGGVVGCASALSRHGIFVLDRRHHVRAGEAGLRRLPSNCVECGITTTRRVPQLPVDPWDVALVTATNCLDAENLVVVLDSVLNLQLATRDELERLFCSLPGHVRRVLELTDRAESGTETLARLRLRRLGLPVACQVVIAGVGRVDLLVGERLVIEVDSELHHTSREAYERDRARDRRLWALGFVVVRVTFRQVLFEWAQVEQDVMAMVARGLHRR